MRTTVNIDDEKGRELMQLTTAPSMSKAIQAALAEYIDMKRKKQLLALRGKLEIVDNWQELRERDVQDLPHE
jgi:hypothetical protein